MPDQSRQVAIEVSLRNRQRFRRDASDTSGDVDRMGRSMKGADKDAKGLGSRLKGLGSAAALGVAGIGVLGFSLGKKFVADATESRKVAKLTEAVIKSTGGAAKITADQVGDLAGSVSAKTGVDDEAIQTGANFLLTYTKIRNEVGKGNDIFNRSVQAITDMGAALGKDPVASATMLGKALNDPIKGVTALGKVGVGFSAEQKKRIEGYVKENKIAKAQGVILDELGVQFGGAAAAAGTPMDKLNVTIGGISETIGGYLLPQVDRFAAWLNDEGAPKVERFVKLLAEEWIPSGIELAKTVGSEVMPRLKEFVGGARDLYEWGKKNQEWVVPLLGFLGGFALTLKLVTVGTKAWAAAQIGLNIAMTANPIGLIIAAVAGLVVGLVLLWKKSDTFRRGVWTMALAGVKAVRFLTDAFLGLVENLIRGAAKAFGWVPGIGPKLKTAAAAFGVFRDKANEKLRGIEKNIQMKIDDTQAKQTLATWQKQLAGGDPGFIGPVAAGSPVDKARNKRPPARATGGYQSAGRAYWVGERGPELHVPAGSGQIVPMTRLANVRTASVSGAVLGGDGASTRPIVVQVVLDGRVIAESTATAVADREARR